VCVVDAKRDNKSPSFLLSFYVTDSQAERERERERERVGFRSVKLKESAIKSGVCFPSITYNGVSTCQLL
jgi:hypothetical protein